MRPDHLQRRSIQAAFVAAGKSTGTARVYAGIIYRALQVAGFADPKAIEALVSSLDTDQPDTRRLRSVWLQWQALEPLAPAWPTTAYVPPWAPLAEHLHDAGLTYAELCSRRWHHLRTPTSTDPTWYAERRQGYLVPIDGQQVLAAWATGDWRPPDLIFAIEGQPVTEARMRSILTRRSPGRRGADTTRLVIPGQVKARR